MVRRSFYLHCFDISLALGSLLAINPSAMPQTTQPQLHSLVPNLYQSLCQEVNDAQTDTQPDITPDEDQLQQPERFVSLPTASLNL